MWGFAAYRSFSPGARVVSQFIDMAKPAAGASIADCGCGTGKAGVKLAKAGFDVVLVDFTGNCRDADAESLTFIEADLSEAIPAQADYAFCADVMEHIPPEQIDAVLANLFTCAPRVFLQISTVDDCCGKLIGERLHLSVHPHAWWREKLAGFGRILQEEEKRSASLFYMERPCA